MMKYRVPAIASAAGAVGGYLYYRLVGCSSGSCLISSTPLISVPYGALLGYLAAGIFKR